MSVTGSESVEGGGIFVLGCPRSGTSVLAWALAQHEHFWTSAESGQSRSRRRA